MAGVLSSAAGSPPSHGDPAQDWELLTMSASALLANGHGLGFGLPPRSTPSLHTGGTHDDGASRRDGDSDEFIFRSFLPLDVSQIAVICTSSTPSVEPFTEGWKPQFRIAGAPLQEDYYAVDPFAPATSNTGSCIEPFLDMEQSFVKEPDKAFLEKKKGFVSPPNTVNCAKGFDFLPQQEMDQEHQVAHEQVMEMASSNSDLIDSSKGSKRKTQGRRFRQKRQGFFLRKSYVVWSVALTTALLGVILVTYCSQTKHHELLQELSPGDENLSLMYGHGCLKDCSFGKMGSEVGHQNRVLL